MYGKTQLSCGKADAMKVIGACVVMLASLCFGLQIQRDRKRRTRCLSTLTEALQLLTGELATNRTPLPELMNWTAKHTQGQASSFFRSMASAFSRLGSESFYELWHRAAMDCLTDLSSDNRDEVMAVGKQLGRVELSKQLAALEGCRNTLMQSLEREEKLFQKEKRISIGLPSALGAMLTILLL